PPLTPRSRSTSPAPGRRTTSFASRSDGMLVEVALPVPLLRTFTYRSTSPLREGTRVRVPFGGRRLIGWVVGEASGARELKQLRDVDRVLDDEPSASPDVLELCRWIADYYVAPLGIVLRGALPAVLSSVTRAEPPVKRHRVLRIVRELPTLTLRDETFGRAQRQRECYEAIEASGGRADAKHLTTLGFSSAIQRALIEKGLVEVVEERAERDPFAEIAPPPPTRHVPSAAQRAAIDAL